MLLKHLNIQDNNGNTPLHIALHKLKDYANPSLLMIAQLLVASGADPEIPNNDGVTALSLVPSLAEYRRNVSEFSSVVDEIFFTV